MTNLRIFLAGLLVLLSVNAQAQKLGALVSTNAVDATDTIPVTTDGGANLFKVTVQNLASAMSTGSATNLTPWTTDINGNLKLLTNVGGIYLGANDQMPGTTVGLTFGRATNEVWNSGFNQIVVPWEGGFYNDIVNKFGQNLGNVAGQQRWAIALESKFRQATNQPYGAEFNLDYLDATGTIARRPIGVFVNHTNGNTGISLEGQVNFFSSTGVQNGIYFDNGNFTLVGGQARLMIQHGQIATDSINITGGPAGVAAISFDGGYIQKTPVAGDYWGLLYGSLPATSGSPLVSSTTIGFGTAYWNGSASVTEYAALYIVRNSTNAGDYSWAFDKSVQTPVVTITGTTNQVVFGGTNTPPASSSAPTKWISVRVAGDATQYRLPLYQ